MGDEKIYDPSSVGPGEWFLIHVLARRARNIPGKIYFRDFMDVLTEEIKCEMCREHLRDYLARHPLSEYEDREEGYFVWSVKFHNAVNKRLGKPEMSLRRAKALYRAPLDSTGDSGKHCEGCVYTPMLESPRGFPTKKARRVLTRVI